MAKKAGDITVEAGPVRFGKGRILKMERYGNRRDLLCALLEDGKTYSHDEIQSLIDDFLKERVV